MSKANRIPRYELERLAADGDESALVELRRRERNEVINAEMHAKRLARLATGSNSDAQKQMYRNQLKELKKQHRKPGGWYDWQGYYHPPEEREDIPQSPIGPVYVEPTKRSAGEYAAYLGKQK